VPGVTLGRTQVPKPFPNDEEAGVPRRSPRFTR
jgi:hypothetical protein